MFFKCYKDRHGKRCKAGDFVYDLRDGSIWELKYQLGFYGEYKDEFRSVNPKKYFIKVE